MCPFVGSYLCNISEANDILGDRHWNIDDQPCFRCLASSEHILRSNSLGNSKWLSQQDLGLNVCPYLKMMQNGRETACSCLVKMFSFRCSTALRNFSVLITFFPLGKDSVLIQIRKACLFYVYLCTTAQFSSGNFQASEGHFCILPVIWVSNQTITGSIIQQAALS